MFPSLIMGRRVPGAGRRNRPACRLEGYPAGVSTSPLDPQDIRAAAEVHRELGPEYSDEVVAAFIDRVDRAVAARVEARLAAERAQRPERAERAWQPAPRRSRRTVFKDVALGLCAGALVAGVSISHVHAGIAHQMPVPAVHRPAPPPPPPGP
jgi:hypothetical protein